MGLPIKHTRTFGRVTQTAGTIIRLLIPPVRGLTTVITGLEYLPAATAHTLTILQALGKTTLSAAAAASQAVVNITADPGATTSLFFPTNVAAGALAASDKVVIRQGNGIFQYNTVSSISTLAVTLASNLDYATPAGAEFWYFGVAANGHPAELTVASTLYSKQNPNGLWASLYPGDPLIIESDNATNAGFLERVDVAYCDFGHR